jgi:hypothetical protein
LYIHCWRLRIISDLLVNDGSYEVRLLRQSVPFCFYGASAD